MRRPLAGIRTDPASPWTRQLKPPSADINRDFYSRHAADFDRTRHPGGWPGWRRVVEAAARATDRPLRVLDLGCGNGRFALFLAREPELLGHTPFTYRGIDLSSELIDHARAATAGLDHIRFRIDDIENCALDEATYHLVALFGVLHHLPGFETRCRTLARAASAVAPGGLLALTCWQFADDPGFERRRLDWASEAGVDPAELEPGDHLLRWGPGDSHARRYCHHTGRRNSTASSPTCRWPKSPATAPTDPGPPEPVLAGCSRRRCCYFDLKEDRNP